VRGSGLGLLYDKDAETRTYMDINQYDIGLGLGAGKYWGLIIFQDREVLEQFRAGVWKTRIGAESAAGTKSASMASPIGKGASIHILTETGATLAASARFLNLSVNSDLTDVGVAEVSIPNTGFTGADRQGDDAPRIWDHKLPFLAQKVIDLGYDLPLPYGIGLTYANVDQEMLLGELDVGINGGAKEPFTFVAFDNANAINDTVQLKLDAWLFPFMNVFAMLGKVDGEAPLDVTLDGNGMLDQLGITCPDLLCLALKDKTIVLPIEAKFSGKTYGVGTILAGGWNNWFVTVPISVTYADMDTTETDGLAITFTPRFGKTFNLGKRGNLALFAGGNYLEAELTVEGNVSAPSGLLDVAYTIEQSNTDRWNLLLGGNWDITKRWSWHMEYNGFIGSRDAFITSLVRRF
jgi:hypothetical protein